MKLITTIIIIVILALFLNACKKLQEESCSPTEPVTLTTDSVIYEGWPMYLSADNYYTGQSFTYKWKGPAGWSKESVYPSSDSPMEIVDSMTAAKAGIYMVDIMSEDCILKHGEINIQVVPVPNPPCTVTNNSTTTSVAGIGGTTYNNIEGSTAGSSTYFIEALGSSQNISFLFNDNDIPIPGVYTSYHEQFISGLNRVRITINTPLQYYNMNSGHAVYVNLVNGHTVISFCNGVFHDPSGNGAITISGKITLP
ncbi:MAG: hypothetical protein K0S23_776 [Fluviicola sp.]|jgi:hypothetical protein|uniref:hypothetical protein n=1 Tax=Fluviicola sp. TaxID=1917219 RepID=UPI00261C8791|nr:hypothetical protein [Fluviicola sp.]MDF3026469.1 hypothetical protein [Fluviicola sp.]